jgi:L-glyceraldehyde 3-phosphate reductase
VFGQVLGEDLAPYRDELVISTKAGYDMWPGPYGEWGSRKYLLASLDQSLARMGLEYVDIFYSHRFDPDTPLEETMGALATAVAQGKALYAGISSYSAAKTREAAAILRGLGVVHPSAVVLDVQPLDRDRPASRHAALVGAPRIGARPGPGPATDRHRGRITHRDRERLQQRPHRERMERVRGLADRCERASRFSWRWLALRDPRMTSLVIAAAPPS